MVASRAQRQTRAARTRRKPQDRRLAPRLGVHWLQFLVGDALSGQGSASRRRSLRADQEAVPKGHHGGGSRLPVESGRQSDLGPRQRRSGDQGPARRHAARALALKADGRGRGQRGAVSLPAQTRRDSSAAPAAGNLEYFGRGRISDALARLFLESRFCFAWSSLDSLVRNETFQWVTAALRSEFFSRSSPRNETNLICQNGAAPRTFDGRLVLTRSAHKDQSRRNSGF